MKNSNVRNRLVHGLVCVLAFLIVLFLGISYYRISDRKEIQTIQQKTQLIAQHYALAMGSDLTRLSENTEVIKAYVMGNGGTTNGVQDVADGIVERSEVRMACLAPNGVVKEVYPADGNESVLGTDLFQATPYATAASQAYQNNETTLTVVDQSEQGNLSITAIEPVYIEENGTTAFWGMVSVTMDFQDVLERSGLNSLNAQGYAYQVISAGDEKEATKLLHSDEKLIHGYRSADIMAYDSLWTLRVSPADGWKDAQSLNVWILTSILIAVLVSVCICLSFLVLRRSRDPS